MRGWGVHAGPASRVPRLLEKGTSSPVPCWDTSLSHSLFSFHDKIPLVLVPCPIGTLSPLFFVLYLVAAEPFGT